MKKLSINRCQTFYLFIVALLLLILLLTAALFVNLWLILLCCCLTSVFSGLVLASATQPPKINPEETSENEKYTTENTDPQPTTTQLPIPQTEETIEPQTKQENENKGWTTIYTKPETQQTANPKIDPDLSTIIEQKIKESLSHTEIYTNLTFQVPIDEEINIGTRKGHLKGAFKSKIKSVNTNKQNEKKLITKSHPAEVETTEA